MQPDWKRTEHEKWFDRSPGLLLQSYRTIPERPFVSAVMTGRNRSLAAWGGLLGTLATSLLAIAQLPDTRLQPISIPPPPALAPPAAQIVVPALQPGGQFALRLSDGAAPFEVTISAGAHSTLFGIVRTADTTKTLSGGVPLLVSTSTTLASASELLGVRFKGTSSGTALPAQIPLSVSVRDGRGRTASVATTVFPVAPRLAIGATFTGSIARQALSVPLQIQGVPPGMNVALRGGLFPSLTLQETGCVFMFNSAPAAVRADSLGMASFPGVQGAFGVRPDASERGPCTIAVQATVGPAGGTQAFHLKQGGLTLAQPVYHEVRDTFVLRELFGFTAQTRSLLNGTQNLGYPEPIGLCQGDSLGFETVKVGVVNVGGDLAFRIRSGPIGTVCEWRSRLAPIDSGLQLGSFRWSVTKVGSKCCSGAVTGCDPETSRGMIAGDAMPLITGTRSTAADQDFFQDGWGNRIAATIDGSQSSVSSSAWGKYQLNPATVHLHCNATVVNDHGITLLLESVTLRGPPGSSFP